MGVYIDPCDRGFLVYRKGYNGLFVNISLHEKLSNAFNRARTMLGDTERLILNHRIVAEYGLAKYCGETFKEDV